MTTSDITIRPLTATDLDRFLALEGPSYGPPGRDFLTTAAENHYRPHWTWVAERDGWVVARAAWWGAPDDDHPIALDWFDLAGASDRVAIGAELLRAAGEQVRTEGGGFPEYHLFLPADWHDRPDTQPTSEPMPPARRACARSSSGCGSSGRRRRACRRWMTG